MTDMQSVIPAKAGISGRMIAGIHAECNHAEAPAFAGATVIA